MCQALEDKDQIYFLHTIKANLILLLPVSVNHYTQGKTALLLSIGVLPAVQPHWTGGAHTGLCALYILLKRLSCPSVTGRFQSIFCHSFWLLAQIPSSLGALFDHSLSPLSYSYSLITPLLQVPKGLQPCLILLCVPHMVSVLVE